MVLVPLAASALLLDSAEAQSATVKLPVFDQRIDHPEPENTSSEAATFGWSMAIGRVGNPANDLRDDLIIASVKKDAGEFEDVGRVYGFEGPDLVAYPNHATIDPATAENTEWFGILNMVIGDVIGSAADPDDTVNLVFIPAPNRTMNHTDCVPSNSAAPVGAVDVYDLSQPSGSPVATITPPPLAGDDLPCDVRNFGHWVAIADVDGDDHNDLIIAAPGSDFGEGRVYIFFGHEDWLTNDGWLMRWAVLLPPPDPDVVNRFPRGGSFGFSLAGADLDDDGNAEVIVARPERGNGPGRVHIFSGLWISENFHGATTLTPPAPDDIDSSVDDVYQTLIDPESLPDDPPSPFAPDNTASFGWIVRVSGEDLGSPHGQAVGFDGKPDVVIHSESGKGYGRTNGSIVKGGAVFVFMNTAVGSPSSSWVDAAQPVRLMTPRIKDAQSQPVVYPQEDGRFGRGWDIADWEKLNGDPTKILVVGESNRSLPDPPGVMSIVGAVYAFELPLDPDFNPNDLEADHLNAWGDFVLYEPSGELLQNQQKPLDVPGALDPQENAAFGAWIEAGRYDELFPGEQLVISARARDIEAFGTTYHDNGRVHTLTLPKHTP